VPFKSKKAKAEEISAQTENPVEEPGGWFEEESEPSPVVTPASPPAAIPPQDDPVCIRVLRIYQGRRTNEQKIAPGVYEWDDARLYGLAQYLLDNKHAVEVLAK
jgi:hypothetical protein